MLAAEESTGPALRRTSDQHAIAAEAARRLPVIPGSVRGEVLDFFPFFAACASLEAYARASQIFREGEAYFFGGNLQDGFTRSRHG
jgi:hypothetical protein